MYHKGKVAINEQNHILHKEALCSARRPTPTQPAAQALGKQKDFAGRSQSPPAGPDPGAS